MATKSLVLYIVLKLLFQIHNILIRGYYFIFRKKENFVIDVRQTKIYSSTLF
jgi:hypothetical protein